MHTVTMEEAKAQLPELLEAAAETHQTFEVVNTKGDAMTVSVCNVAASHLPRVAGFMKGEIVVPEDFDTMCQEEILQMFGIPK